MFYIEGFYSQAFSISEKKEIFDQVPTNFWEINKLKTDIQKVFLKFSVRALKSQFDSYLDRC